ncbi:hypothetical protein AB0J90_00915 [Micromonospora sp. NPDC049523]|uniref:hypothetical protein n=1 Tax=Micromonospora sp. NPDC049523 TaxID=3155921 RepID=UPI00342FE100
MLWISIGAIVAVALIGVVAVRGRQRTGTGSSRDEGARALQAMSRDARRRRGYRVRGSGSHFGQTPIKKYGDERHGDPDSGWGDSGGGWGGGGDSGGGGSSSS